MWLAMGGYSHSICRIEPAEHWDYSLTSVVIARTHKTARCMLPTHLCPGVALFSAVAGLQFTSDTGRCSALALLTSRPD
jgi:hypothetical protein